MIGEILNILGPIETVFYLAIAINFGPVVGLLRPQKIKSLSSVGLFNAAVFIAGFSFLGVCLRFMPTVIAKTTDGTPFFAAFLMSFGLVLIIPLLVFAIVSTVPTVLAVLSLVFSRSVIQGPNSRSLFFIFIGVSTSIIAAIQFQRARLEANARVGKSTYQFSGKRLLELDGHTVKELRVNGDYAFIILHDGKIYGFRWEQSRGWQPMADLPNPLPKNEENLRSTNPALLPIFANYLKSHTFKELFVGTTAGFAVLESKAEPKSVFFLYFRNEHGDGFKQISDNISISFADREGLDLTKMNAECFKIAANSRITLISTCKGVFNIHMAAY